MKNTPPARHTASSARHLLHAGLTGSDSEAEHPGKKDMDGVFSAEIPVGDLGDYEIIQKISSGGMGMVYLAWQASLERFVALKFLLPELNALPQFIERFRREAKAAASLRHPNIVSVHEVGNVDGQLFFSMDFIEGRNLAAVVKEGPLPWGVAAGYCQKIAHAIEYAHSRWVLHRDLKPSNVLIDLHDQPQVTDFGLAGKMEVRSHLTMTNHILGSPLYLSPEQASGQVDDITSACDVYGIGVILYECLTGYPPFRAETLQETLLRIREQKPVSPRVAIPTIPKDLETICLKCLEKDPVRRYASAQALADDLTRCLNGEPIFARPPSRTGMVARWIRRHPKMAALYAVSAVIALVFVGRLSWDNYQLFKANHQMKNSIQEKQRNLAEAYNELGKKWREDNSDEKADEFFRKAKSIIQEPASEDRR